MPRLEQLRSQVEDSSRRLALAAVIGISAVALVACGEDVEATEAIGYDVSFPQCNTQLPPAGSFTIVGVNEYLPTFPNPCFPELAQWAEGATGDTSQPALAVYATAANPAAEDVPTWPQAGENMYGDCSGEDSQACAYQYGQDRIINNLQTIAPRQASGLKWWIDVEPEYSWETGGDGQQRNRAVLEGMVQTLQEQAAEVGIYSSPSIWQEIVGQTPADSSLNGLGIWMQGGQDLEQARANCDTPSFTGGPVVIAQAATEGYLDRNVIC